MPPINHCLLCEKNGTSDVVSLTNGNFVHHKCSDQKIKKYLEKKDQLIGIQNSIWEIERDIEKNRGLLRSLFGGEKKINHLKDIMVQKNESAINIKNELRNFSKKYEKILDFWPDYPADWEERRERHIEIYGSRCEQCKSTSVIQLHHIKPLKKGGGHKTDNLLILCRDCHQNKHKHSFEKTINKENTLNYNSDFEKKIDQIRNAIYSKSKIKISYKNMSGKRSTRDILPKRLIAPGDSSDLGTHTNLCVNAFCYKRNEDRIFAIINITKIHSEVQL
jgi:hypothetical protein